MFSQLVISLLKHIRSRSLILRKSRDCVRDQATVRVGLGVLCQSLALSRRAGRGSGGAATHLLIECSLKQRVNERSHDALV